MAPRPPARDVVRAFFAIELDADLRRAAAEVARTLRAASGGRDVRWVRPENLHVTLRFLGDTPRDALPGLAAEVGRAVGPLAPVPLELGPVVAFPSARRPRVVALELRPAEPLVRLAEAVERGVVAAGFEPEPRPFRPHLTLGRVRGRSAPLDAEVPPHAASEVREVALLRSELRASGARYTPLERLALGGPAHP